MSSLTLAEIISFILLLSEKILSISIFSLTSLGDCNMHILRWTFLWKFQTHCYLLVSWNVVAANWVSDTWHSFHPHNASMIRHTKSGGSFFTEFFKSIFPSHILNFSFIPVWKLYRTRIHRTLVTELAEVVRVQLNLKTTEIKSKWLYQFLLLPKVSTIKYHKVN